MTRLYHCLQDFGLSVCAGLAHENEQSIMQRHLQGAISRMQDLQICSSCKKGEHVLSGRIEWQRLTQAKALSRPLHSNSRSSSMLGSLRLTACAPSWNDLLLQVYAKFGHNISGLVQHMCMYKAPFHTAQGHVGSLGILTCQLYSTGLWIWTWMLMHRLRQAEGQWKAHPVAFKLLSRKA